MLDFKYFSEKYYSELRDKAQNEADYYNNLALSASGFSDIEITLKKLNIEKSKAEFSNNAIELANINAQIDSLCKRKLELLDSLKIEPKQLLPAYKCKLCNDTGIDSEFKTCECQAKLFSHFLLHKYGAQLSSFPSFNNSIITEKNKKYFEALEKFCGNFSSYKSYNIFLSGAPGTGKTHLSKCVVRELASLGKSVIYITSFNLINRINAIRFTDSKLLNSMLTDFYSCNLLVIDDLGGEPMIPNLTTEYMLSILNERLETGKATIFTTNLSISDIKEVYNDRFFDRVTNVNNCKVITVESDNMRKI